MNNLTVRAKLTWAFGGLAFLVLLISALAIKDLGDANKRFESYVEGVNASAETAHLVREAIDLRAIAARNLVLVTSSADQGVEKAVVTKAHADVGTNLAKRKKDVLKMNGDSMRKLEREALLSAAATLAASRDELMTCAEILREYQFNTDLAGRSVAAESANELINRAKDFDT
jgi:hypothetical protein